MKTTVVQAPVDAKQKRRIDRLAHLYCLAHGLRRTSTAEAIRHVFDNMSEAELNAALAKRDAAEEETSA